MYSILQIITTINSLDYIFARASSMGSSVIFPSNEKVANLNFIYKHFQSFCEIEFRTFLGHFFCKVEKVPSLWTSVPQVQESASLYSGETINPPPPPPPKNLRKKPTIDRLSIWVSHEFDLFLLQQLSVSWCGSLEAQGATLESPIPPMGYVCPSVH